MTHRRIVPAAVLGLSLSATVAHGLELVETPQLKPAVESGTLDSVDERVPDPPLVAGNGGWRSPGSHGGQLDLLMGSSQDVRMMVVYGYARLVGYNENFELVPDILEAVDVVDDREFTLKLREGHRWSDGAPFTTEDFRYFWEDIANNADISPFGPPAQLLVEGEAPKVEILDHVTVRYSWSNPNPYFLPALAGAYPMYIYAPAHYLKPFHGRYADAEELARKVENAGVRNWAGLHQRNGHLYKADNPDLPVLQPWYNTTPQPSERFVFERNPYFHRVDENGLQLPYIDRVVVNIASQSLIPAKTGAGDSDLQGRYLRLDNFTFLKEGETRNDYEVRLWQTGTGSQIALYPNLNSNNAAWRELVRDVRFRRALSLAIDRDEINQLVYFGLAIPGNNTVLPSSPLFRDDYQSEWAIYDPLRANALLDEMGLTERDNRGVRRMPNGKPIEVIIQSSGESTEQTDVLELIHDTWLNVGVKLYTKPSQRELFRDRVFSGEAMMSVWSGIDNALATADTSPDEFVPTRQDQLQWPMWGQYLETKGEVGEAPDIDSARRLLELRDQWRLAGSREERAETWQRILDIHKDQVFSIGTVCAVPQPIVVDNRLRNVPEEGTYSWAPGAYFGMYRPDQFWIEK
jgi:peptide/nickel transport system substrate-binding protein